MKLDTLTAEIRPRNSWEAVDLGIALTRRDYGTIIKSKFLVVWPVWILLILLLHNHFGWLVFTLLWINVLWEKIPLYYISRTLFGGSRSLKDFLKAWPGWLFKRIFRYLFVSRLAPDRSLTTPVIMLEDMKGILLPQRISGLKSFSGSIGWRMGFIFMLCLHSLWIQLAIILYLLFPFLDTKELSLMMESGQSLPPEFYWTCLFSYLVVFTFITPFYVGAGFGMYLNARTKMEGWDVELTFRKMANRIATASIVLFLGFAGVNASAQEAAKDPQQAIQKVLKDDTFKIHTRTRKVRKPSAGGNSSNTKRVEDRKRFSKNKTPKQRTRRSSGRGFGDGFNLALVGWILLGALALFMIYLFIKWLLDQKGRDTSPEAPREVKTVMGMDVDQKSIPKDLVTQARELWQAGKLRESLALLYRGSLSWLIYTGGVPIRESDTELDCYNRSAEKLDRQPMIAYLKDLTEAWIKVAYGKQSLPDETMVHLLDNWPFDKQASSRKMSKVATTSGLVLLLTLTLTSCNNTTVEEETIEIGYKGKARVYPFLAMERFLDEMSVLFYRVYSFTELPDKNTVIIYPQSIDHEDLSSEKLVEWVSEGGSLIYLLDQVSSAKKTKASLKEKLNGKKKPEKRTHYLLNEFDIEIVEQETEHETIKWGNKDYQWALKNQTSFKVPKRFWKRSNGFRVGEDQDSVAAMQTTYGKGLITLVNVSTPWKNRNIGEGDHASILWEILKRNQDKLAEVWLLRGTRASFTELLRNHAWMPLVSIMVFVIAWLWRSIPRFGPPIPNPESDNRDFQEHLLMTGSFFARKKMESVLIAPVLSRLKLKLKRYDLGEANEHSETEWHRLADATGMNEDLLKWALNTDPKTAPKNYLKRIQLLQRIDRTL